jgi:hypothetical protein
MDELINQLAWVKAFINNPAFLLHWAVYVRRQRALTILNQVPSFGDWFANKGRAFLGNKMMEAPSMGGMMLLGITAPEEDEHDES